MLLFLGSVVLLFVGYAVYGRFIERLFGAQEERVTPAYANRDNVDYVPLPKYKVYLIQLLNIAGVGPIFGPIMGALYGPAALLWIVVGCIFAGAVHDYFSGMISIRNGGQSIPNLTGKYLGPWAKGFTNFFAVLLLLLVGVVFMTAPANLLSGLTGLDAWYFLIAIFFYYLIATLVPVDKIIGHVYPFFGALLLFMSVGLLLGLLLSDTHTILPDMGLRGMVQDYSKSGPPLWPALFITIACGAVSGFHATQSPLMARCVENEENGRFVFYGAMIGEGVIALIWCTIALSYFGGVEGLQNGLAGNPAGLVYDASIGLLGIVGGFLAVLGVIVLPITSGDTSFRSARLILAEFFKCSQQSAGSRLVLALPMFCIGALLTQIDFGVIWRYFGVANQMTAVIMLWTAAVYLRKHQKNHWVCSVPAMFMTAVVSTFLMSSHELGLGMEVITSTIVGLLLSAVFLVVCIKPNRGLNNATQNQSSTVPNSGV